MDLTEIERRLENWGAWARSRAGGGFASGCSSAERRYVAPRDPEGVRLVETSREPIVIGDAEVIEAALLKLKRPVDRALLVATFSDRFTTFTIASMFKIKPRLVRPHQVRVMRDLQHLLDHDRNLVLASRRHARGLHPAAQSNKYKVLTNEVTGA